MVLFFYTEKSLTRLFFIERRNMARKAEGRSPISGGVSPRITTPALSSYSNDYQAEINKRTAINPNDPQLQV